jgi:diguanylate cyclase (GGDEF)-like protein/PAS domain S-box-containing protein
MLKQTLSPLNKIKIVLVGGGLIALLLLVAYLSVSLKGSNISNWTQDAAHSARQLAGWVDYELDQAKSRLVYVSKLPQFSTALDRQLVDRSINGIPLALDPKRREVLDWTLKESSYGFNVLFVLFPNGDHYLSHPFSVQKSLKTYNLSHRSYFNKATIYKQPVLSNAFVGADGIPAIALDVPITNENGEITSHLGGVLHLSMMSELLSKQGRHALDERYFLLDRKGNEVVKTGLDTDQFLQLKAFMKGRGVWQSLEGDYPYLTDVIHQSGNDQLVILVRLQSGWTLGVVSGLDIVSEQFSDDIRHTAFIAAFLICLIIGASILLVQKIGSKWQLAEDELKEVNDQLELRVERRTEQLVMREKGIQDAKDRLQDIIEATRVGTWEWNLQSGACEINQRWAEIAGYDRDELFPLTIPTWERLVHKDDLTHVQEKLNQHLKGEVEHFACEIRMQHKEGHWVWVLIQGRATELDGLGKPVRMSGTCMEISERKKAEAALKMAASVFSHAREGILITNSKGLIVDVNDTFTLLTGYSKGESLGRNPSFLKSGLQPDSFYKQMWEELEANGHWSGEIWNRKKSGEFFAELLTISAVKEKDGQINNYVALFSDITRSKMNEQRLEHVAHYDPLTNLPNRVLLADRLNQALLLAKRKKELVLVAYIDLDGFKQINDNYGHDQGDYLLIEIARKMKSCLRGSDTIARLGGDEFVAVLTGFQKINDSITLLERLLKAASLPVLHKQRQFKVSASIGVTSYPQLDEVAEDQLLRQADQAMYQAKIEGKNRYHFFSPEKDRAAKGFNENLKSIKKALGRNEFVLYYQPKVNMKTGSVIGFEALIRWNHPERGLLAPAQFLPIVEGHSLSIELGDWVLATALCQLNVWSKAGLDFTLSINVSSLEIQQTDFVDKLRQSLSKYPDLKPSALSIEILETSALEDVDQVSSTIVACQNLGISFSLDDFGTGYSSLTYLKRLPAAELKIDQSFVRDMLDDPDDLAILQGVLSLSRAFRREVIAEGVETEEHGIMLLQLGCENGQGYGIAKPLPAHEVEAWVKAWNPPSSWVETVCFTSKQTSVLNAVVELKAWMKTIIETVQSSEFSVEKIELSYCYLGRWIENEGASVLPKNIDMHRVVDQHEQLHEAAEALFAAYQLDQPKIVQNEITAFVSKGEQLVSSLMAAALAHSD